MAKLPRPQAPASFRAMFPDLADWLESPWTGPPPFMAARTFRVEEVAEDDRYVIRAELPGLDPDKDIEVTVEGRALTIHAQRRRQERGPCRSEFRYGSLTRLVRLPARVDAKDVTARYEKGVLEVSVPVREARPESSRSRSRSRLSPGTNTPGTAGTSPPAPAPARRLAKPASDRRPRVRRGQSRDRNRSRAARASHE